jgi:hypothetical protein
MTGKEVRVWKFRIRSDSYYFQISGITDRLWKVEKTEVGPKLTEVDNPKFELLMLKERLVEIEKLGNEEIFSLPQRLASEFCLLDCVWAKL